MKILIDKELFQWEKNRQIQLILEDGDPQITHVQFYNCKISPSPISLLIGNYAQIPDELLQYPYPIMAVACSDTWAIARREFKVLKRVKPENYDDNEGGESYLEIILDGGEEI